MESLICTIGGTRGTKPFKPKNKKNNFLNMQQYKDPPLNNIAFLNVYLS